MRLFVAVVLFTFLLTVNSFAQIQADFNVEKRVEKLLQTREITELAGELVKNPSVSTEDLLIKLSVFARAGHRQRVRETLKQIGEIYSSASNQNYILNTAERALESDDFVSQKIFYEKIAVNGDDCIGNFINLWREKDVGELEKWLEVRAGKSAVWERKWIRLKLDLGTANEIYEPLEQQIRANPNDAALVGKYLQIVQYFFNPSTKGNFADKNPDPTWLADVVPLETAYESYEFAGVFIDSSPETAIKLYKKSLALPFTQKDTELFAQKAFRYASLQPVVKNPEKQLRFWTKSNLAEVYQQTKQSDLAQPLLEDLKAMDKSDIQTTDNSHLAGLVQSATGQRVIEKQILEDEKDKQDSYEYWLERAEYYRGRKENESVWQTYLQALNKFEYKPDDRKNTKIRLYILSSFAYFGKNFNKSETSNFLRNELSKAIQANDADYLLGLLPILNDEFENLRDEFFVNTELLPQVLSLKKFWGNNEKFRIEEVLESENWDREKREAILRKLVDLAFGNVRLRAYSLVDAMSDKDAEKAVLLLEELIKSAPENYEDNLNYKRQDVERALFSAYINSCNWEKAEKMYLGGYSYWGNELNSIAVAAARKGAVKDAVRLWKLNANLDRRKLDGLFELTQTDAKPLLQGFYKNMKKQDVLTNIPDKALSILK